MEALKNYINGKWVGSHESATLDVVNPANQELLAKVPFGSKTVRDVQDAVAVAGKAQEDWRSIRMRLPG